MDHHTPKGAPKMADTDAHAAWMKENTVVISIRLQKSTDADIIEFLKDKSKQGVIKQALRLMMEAENK